MCYHRHVHEYVPHSANCQGSVMDAVYTHVGNEANVCAPTREKTMTPFLRFVMHWLRDLSVKDFFQLHNSSSIVINVLNIKIISHTFVESIHIICLRANKCINNTYMYGGYLYLCWSCYCDAVQFTQGNR